MAFEKRFERHHDARCAKAALQAVRLVQCLLQRRQRFIDGNRLDRRHLMPLHLDGVGEAGPHGLAIHQHRAGAAHTVLTTHVGAGETTILAQRVRQQLARFNQQFVVMPVDGQRDRTLLHMTHIAHPLARLKARSRARSTSVWVSSLRYTADMR